MANTSKDDTKEAIREYFLQHNYRVKDEAFSKHFRQSIRGINHEFAISIDIILVNDSALTLYFCTHRTSG